jgi:SAM-dependent methyltransferase
VLNEANYDGYVATRLCSSATMNSDTSFYDDLASIYHLVYQDWATSIDRQGRQLAALFGRKWPNSRNILDVACGIGTQTLALARVGFNLTASDLSSAAVDRAKLEAETRGLTIGFSVCDMREAHAHHGGGFDIAICADNSLPHLLTDVDLRRALQQMYDCVRPGGGCVLTVRDYDSEPRGRNIFKPYGVRVEGEKRYMLFQVWDFDDHYCNITLYCVEEILSTGQVATRTMRSKYYAVSTTLLLKLMKQVGFQGVERLDDVFYQPVLIGSKGGQPVERGVGENAVIQ